MNKSLFSILLLLILGFSDVCDAQQDPLLTQYFFNPIIVNSGYAGTRDALSVTIHAREQWMGLDGRPRTQSLTMHAPSKNETLAAGLSVINDVAGELYNTSIAGDFAFRIPIDRYTKMAFGLKGGVTLTSIRFSELENTGDDIYFGQDIKNEALPNVGFSYYLWSKKFFFGLSAPKLLENDLRVEDINLYAYTQKRHFFAMGGYVFGSYQKVKFKPTAMFRYTEGVGPSFDVTANFLFEEQLWVGATYRHQAAVGLILSYQVTKQLRMGYSYDLGTNRLAGFNSGSHELMISCDFLYDKFRLLSPRYF